MSQISDNAKVQADPSMTLIAPEEEYASTYTFATPEFSGKEVGGARYSNYLTIVVRRNFADSVS